MQQVQAQREAKVLSRLVSTGPDYCAVHLVAGARFVVPVAAFSKLKEREREKKGQSAADRISAADSCGDKIRAGSGV